MRSVVESGGSIATSSRSAPTLVKALRRVALSSKTKARAPACGATTMRTKLFSRTTAGVPSS
ncbi:MAG: hypothetical protein ACLPYS_19355 [Vulcanimicrobiaceae bacterium]